MRNDDPYRLSDFEVIRMQPGQGLRVGPDFGGQLKPVRLWVMPHGAVDNKPSYVWEMVDPVSELVFYCQITDKMLADGICAAGAMKVLSEQ